jgi:hypothetical protein
MGTSLVDAETIAWEMESPDTYTKSKRINPKGPAEGESRVRRGRPAHRSANKPDTAYSVISFRVLAEEK